VGYSGRGKKTTVIGKGALAESETTSGVWKMLVEREKSLEEKKIWCELNFVGRRERDA